MVFNRTYSKICVFCFDSGKVEETVAGRRTRHNLLFRMLQLLPLEYNYTDPNGNKLNLAVRKAGKFCMYVCLCVVSRWCVGRRSSSRRTWRYAALATLLQPLVAAIFGISEQERGVDYVKTLERISEAELKGGSNTYIHTHGHSHTHTTSI